MAARCDCVELIEWMVDDMEVPVAAKPGQVPAGGSALCIAGEMGHERALKALIERGPRGIVLAARGTMPIISAIRFGSLKCVELLIDAGALSQPGEVHPLVFAAECGHFDIVQAIVSRRPRMI
jgi:ankyrin repeat protein